MRTIIRFYWSKLKEAVAFFFGVGFLCGGTGGVASIHRTALTCCLVYSLQLASNRQWRWGGQQFIETTRDRAFSTFCSWLANHYKLRLNTEKSTQMILWWSHLMNIFPVYYYYMVPQSSVPWGKLSSMTKCQSVPECPWFQASPVGHSYIIHLIHFKYICNAYYCYGL